VKIAETGEQVALRGADGQNHVLDVQEIEDLAASSTSLMPAGLLDALPNDEVCDLYVFLKNPEPAVEAAR